MTDKRGFFSSLNVLSFHKARRRQMLQNFARLVAGATAAIDVTAELPFVHQMDLSLEFSGAIFARTSAWIQACE